jgi:hypothetical protein
MTNKERNIIDFLKGQNGQAYYIDIREHVGCDFDDEDDFDNTLKLLNLKNWIYEKEDGTTVFQLNEKMTKTVSCEFEIEDYVTLTNGSDGGRSYLKTKTFYRGQERNLIVFFLNKGDEEKVQLPLKIKIEGDLMDEGNDYSLTLFNSIFKI